MALNSGELLSRSAAEAVGTMLLLAVVVGSGIMGETLAQGNAAIALLANSIATGAALVVLIWILGPLSGAHFNPAVSWVMALRGELGWHDLSVYVLAQVAGAVAGVILAHAMFDLSLLQQGTRVRSGGAQLLSEVVATFGLVSVILGCLRHRPTAVAVAVGLYITAAYWFTASTSFANPAVTLARSFTTTFAGIRLSDVLPFVLAQFTGAGIALVVDKVLNKKAVRR